MHFPCQPRQRACSFPLIFLTIDISNLNFKSVLICVKISICIFKKCFKSGIFHIFLDNYMLTFFSTKLFLIKRSTLDIVVVFSLLYIFFPDFSLALIAAFPFSCIWYLMVCRILQFFYNVSGCGFSFIYCGQGILCSWIRRLMYFIKCSILTIMASNIAFLFSILSRWHLY